MPQHDLEINRADGNIGVDYRSQLNVALKSAGTLQAGPSQPSATYDCQFWVDTTSMQIKLRNTADNEYNSIGTLQDCLNLAKLSAANKFTGESEFQQDQKVKGAGLLWRYRDTATGKEWGVRVKAGFLEFCENTGTEVLPSWQVRLQINSSGQLVAPTLSDLTYCQHEHATAVNGGSLVGYEKRIAAYTVPSNVREVVFSSLPPKPFRVLAHLKKPLSGVSFGLVLNGDTSNNYINGYMSAQDTNYLSYSGAVSGAAIDRFAFAASAVNGWAILDCQLSNINTQTKCMHTLGYSKVTMRTIQAMGGIWKNAVDYINSITITGFSGEIGAGSYIEIWTPIDDGTITF